MKKAKGFTLIEIVIVAAIVGIIALVALPLYERHERKVTRTDAVRALGTAANDMEKCAAAQGGVYTNCFFTSRELLGNRTPNGKYNLVINILGGGTGFLISAIRVAGRDFECNDFATDINYQLIINNLGQEGIFDPTNTIIPNPAFGNILPAVRGCWNK